MCNLITKLNPSQHINRKIMYEKNSQIGKPNDHSTYDVKWCVNLLTGQGNEN